MVQSFGLVRSAAAKYADGVTLIGEEVFYQHLRRNGQAAELHDRGPITAWTDPPLLR